MAIVPVPPTAAPPAPDAPGSDGALPGMAALPRRRKWLLRAVVAGAVLGALVVAGRRFYSELHRLRDVPASLIALIFLLWMASRYPAAEVMRISLRALGHRIGRYEAFMLQMVQSYGNVLVPRAGIGMPALYMKLRHGTPIADFGAVQILPMTLLQVFTLGLTGLAAQAALLAPGGQKPDRTMATVFAAVVVACAAPLVLPLPAGRFGHGRVAAFIARLVGAWQKLGRSRAVLVRCVATHGVMMLIRALRLFVCFYAIGERVPYSGALAASLLADLAFVFSITPSGLGFREAAVVYAAPAVGASREVALAAGVLDRLVGTACNIILGQIGILQFIRPALRLPVSATVTGITPTPAPPPAR